jgi:hypothetical protein
MHSIGARAYLVNMKQPASCNVRVWDLLELIDGIIKMSKILETQYIGAKEYPCLPGTSNFLDDPYSVPPWHLEYVSD